MYIEGGDPKDKRGDFKTKVVFLRKPQNTREKNSSKKLGITAAHKLILNFWWKLEIPRTSSNICQNLDFPVQWTILLRILNLKGSKLAIL